MARTSAVAAAVAAALMSPLPATAQSDDDDTAFDRTNIGDWVVECLPGQTGPTGCQLYQRVLTNDPGIVAMAVAFVWSEERESLQTQIAMPLGVLLSYAPQLRIGDSYSTQLAWSRCISDGCLVEGFTPPETVQLMHNSQTASITVLHPLEGEVSIPVSLRGFTQALEQILPEGTLERILE
ncbi:MAG: invasion associated locus B family protein [Pseudomonadota bacterium]